MKYLMLFSLAALLGACGDGTPFDEDYWDTVDGDSRAEETDRNDGHFSVELTPLTGIGFTQGSATIDLNGNEAILAILMEGVPSNIIQGNITTIDGSCESIISSPPTTGTTEARNWSFTENGTRAALFPDLSAGATVETRSLVVHAFSQNLGAGGGASPLFPFACGPIIRPSGDEGAGPDAPSSAAGATGGGTTVDTGGGVTGGLTAGTPGGVDGGVAGGVDGGVAGGGVTTVGGAAGGTTVGGATDGGVTTGGVGGTPGGVTTTGGAGTTTGGVGGTPGGVTTTGGAGGTFAF